jgi:hypothetical protein
MPLSFGLNTPSFLPKSPNVMYQQPTSPFAPGLAMLVPDKLPTVPKNAAELRNGKTSGVVGYGIPLVPISLQKQWNDEFVPTVPSTDPRSHHPSTLHSEPQGYNFC